MSYRRYSRSSRSGRRDMVAKYAGACQCGAKVGAGFTITYDYGSRAIVSCPACTPERRLERGDIVGPCWECGDAAGKFRRVGAVATPVRCDACHERLGDKASMRPMREPDASDLAYEDQCAAACGLDGFDRQN